MPPKGYKYTQLCYHTNFNFSIKIIIDTILLKTTVRCVINIKENHCIVILFEEN